MFYSNDVKKRTLNSYADPSWGDDLTTSKYTTGVLTYIDSNFAYWSLNIQSIVVHSTEKEEYIATDTETKTVMWFRPLMSEWDEKQNGQKSIHEANMGCVSQSRGRGGSSRPSTWDWAIIFLRRI